MIDPAFLDELDRFAALRKRNLAAGREGEQATRRVGEGLTFSDYRRYAKGDDTRLIDWKVFARTGELFIKQFEAERNFTVHALVDASRSMAYGEGSANKFEYAAKLGLGFAYLTAADHNDFRFSLLGPSIDRLDDGASSRGEILRLIDRCNAADPAGQVDFEDSLETYAAGIRSRSLIVLASDFLADLNAIEHGLQALDRNHVILAHVIAPDERDPPVRGDTIFEDMEADGRRRVYFGGRRAEEYRRRLEGHLDGIAGRADRLGMRHEVIDTDEAFFDAFARCWIA